MRYEFATDLQVKAEEICQILFPHIKIPNVRCLRSYGSSSPRTIARCHALGKVMQKAMGVKPFYAIEFISEKFDKMSEEEQVKTIIHELMHVPKSFGGGFKHHDHVTDRNVNKAYKKYKEESKKRNFNTLLEEINLDLNSSGEKEKENKEIGENEGEKNKKKTNVKGGKDDWRNLFKV